MDNRNFKGSMEAIKSGEFYKKLDDSSHTLRQLAGEAADFLGSLKTSSPLLNQLEKAFLDAQGIAIEKMDEGLGAIRHINDQINTEMQKSGKLLLEEASFFALIEKQNQFNHAANHLFATAVELFEAGR